MIMHQVLHCEPLPIRRLDPTIPRDLEAVCLKCLEKLPSRRYETAGAMAGDLRRWLRNQPTLARPAGVLRRTFQWGRRRPALAALWLVSLLALVGVFGTNSYRLGQISQALRQSEQQRIIAQQEQLKTAQEHQTAQRLLYALQMRSAQQAWREGNFGRMKNLLDRYAEDTPDANLRHFEWYHLNYLCHVPHRALHGHVGEAYCGPIGLRRMRRENIGGLVGNEQGTRSYRTQRGR